MYNHIIHAQLLYIAVTIRRQPTLRAAFELFYFPSVLLFLPCVLSYSWLVSDDRSVYKYLGAALWGSEAMESCRLVLCDTLLTLCKVGEILRARQDA